ncbi:MAG: hypothetical protein JWO44_1655 [Bacteroidetes bacterium]|nr:hypothetical protein [Bacteroidota bacterium]
MKTICIIGGGFSGTVTAIHLLQKSSDVRVKLINHTYPLVKGVAYSTGRMEHLLNVPAGKMSAFASLPDHFTDWVTAKPEYKQFHFPTIRHSFLPRMIYGKYLEELSAEHLKNERLEIIRSKAVDVKSANGKYVIITENDHRIESDFLVLATGNFQPAPPKLKDPSALSSPNYFSNPWTNDFIEKLKPDESVLLIGSGLTMVDYVLTLVAEGFRGKIYSVSPRGYLPEGHSEQVTAYPDFLEEIKGKGLQSVFSSIISHVQKAAEKNIPWQSVIDSVRPHAKTVWMGLSRKDKQQFISHVRHIWGVARHRLPLDAHKKIRELMQSGQLEVIGGRLQALNSINDSFEAFIKLRRVQDVKTLAVSKIVNCTGPQINFNELNEALVKSLLQQDLISADELKMGIRALPSGNALNSKAEPVPRLYALGSLLRGLMWETTAVPDLRVNAENVAAQIIGSID